MPEGNELHRHAVQHGELFGGRIITVEGPNGRFHEGAAMLNKRKLRSVEAYGKHLFYEFGSNRHLHIHLGLYGKFRTGEVPFPEPRGALRLRFSSRQHWLELRGPTACEVFTTAERDGLVGRIGPDPLREDADPAKAINRIRKSRAPIGALLMDQAVISGIGNIYRAELLFRARLSPFRPGNSVPKECADEALERRPATDDSGYDRPAYCYDASRRPAASEGKSKARRNALRIPAAPAPLFSLRHRDQPTGVRGTKALLVSGMPA